MASRLIDMWSDTVTRPSGPMRSAIAHAEVGNEAEGEDPTVNALLARVCELLGKEAALFLPSGTMCNVVGSLVHCRAGEEMVVEATSHVANYEAGGAAAIAGLMVKKIQGRRGMLETSQLLDAINPPTHYFPRTKLLVIEQTTMIGGGAIWPIDALADIRSAAVANGMKVHMDGARLFNAAVASGVPAKVHASYADSVWVDFTKGLGAPFGAALAGSREFVSEAWRYKLQLGGSLRQAGLMAAAALYGLENNVERLAEDHARARRLAGAIASFPGLRILNDPIESNIVIFGREDGGEVASLRDELYRYGLRLLAINRFSLRAVTHLDIGDQELDRATEIIRQVKL